MYIYVSLVIPNWGRAGLMLPISSPCTAPEAKVFGAFCKYVSVPNEMMIDLASHMRPPNISVVTWKTNTLKIFCMV